MSKGINKAIIVGNLGADPEVRYTPGGNAVANISVATSESWRDKQTGELQEKTEWHRIVLFNRLGEIAGEYLKKGAKVYIEGRLQTKKWQGQDGQDRYTTEIIANEMQMLDGLGGAGGGERGQASRPAAAPAQERSSRPAPAAPAPHYGQGSFYNDEVPF